MQLNLKETLFRNHCKSNISTFHGVQLYPSTKCSAKNFDKYGSSKVNWIINLTEHYEWTIFNIISIVATQLPLLINSSKTLCLVGYKDTEYI